MAGKAGKKGIPSDQVKRTWGPGKTHVAFDKTDAEIEADAEKAEAEKEVIDLSVALEKKEEAPVVAPAPVKKPLKVFIVRDHDQPGPNPLPACIVAESMEAAEERFNKHLMDKGYKPSKFKDPKNADRPHKGTHTYHLREVDVTVAQIAIGI